jgi:hypothetical protein
MQGRYFVANSAYYAAIDEFSVEPDLPLRAQVWCFLGEDRRALEDLDAALQPEDHSLYAERLYLLRAMVYHIGGEFEAASKDYHMAIDLLRRPFEQAFLEQGLWHSGFSNYTITIHGFEDLRAERARVLSLASSLLDEAEAARALNREAILDF